MGLIKKALVTVGLIGGAVVGGGLYVKEHPIEIARAFINTQGEIEADPESRAAVEDTIEIFEPYFADMTFDVPLIGELSYSEIIDLMQMDYVVGLIANELDNNGEYYPAEVVDFYNYIKDKNAAAEAGEEFIESYTYEINGETYVFDSEDKDDYPEGKIYGSYFDKLPEEVRNLIRQKINKKQ